MKKSILKEIIKEEYKKSLITEGTDDSKKIVISMLKDFKSLLKNSIVNIELNKDQSVKNNLNIEFNIGYKLDDPFIKNKYYNDHVATIYPADKLYTEIEKIGKKNGFSINDYGQNNIRTIFWYIKRG